MSDYIFLLESRLGPDQLPLLGQVQQAATEAQMHLFLAGGAVRDLLGGFRIQDLDFSVEGPALRLVRQLDTKRFAVRSVDEHRQSAELVFAGHATLEIARCRTETYPKLAREPVIHPATIQEDLRRRDFSVNAIALSLNPASRGLLLDPNNGIADIERKELRTLSNYSFYEDPARMLRLVRLQARLKYTIAEKTKNQLENAREAGVLEQIQPRRLLGELRQLAVEPEALKALADQGLLGVFAPNLEKKVDWALLARLDKTRQTVEAAGIRVDSFGPFLWSLTRKLSNVERAGLRTRVGMNLAEAKPWTELEARARALQKTLSGKQMTQNSRLYRAVAEEDPAVVMFLLAFSPLAGVRERLRNYFTQLRPAAAGIKDEEVEQLGVKRESPKFAPLREAYVAARLDKKINNKEDAAKVLASHL